MGFFDISKKCNTDYLSESDVETLQKERDSIIDCQPEDIRALYKQMESMLSEYVLCVVGNEDKIEEQKALFDKTFNL